MASAPSLKRKPFRWNAGATFAALLAVILGVLFFRSFAPDFVHFSNDGPLGAISSACARPPGIIFGVWNDLNSIGNNSGSVSPSISFLISWLLGPVGYAKFLAPLALFILGASAWTFFRQLRLSPLAAVLGALAVALNSTFFSDACWGTAAHQIAYGMDFFALALIVSNSAETSFGLRWTRLALAGLCIGVNVMEAADIGALCSLCIAGFAFFKSLAETDKPVFIRAARGVGRVIIIAVFAGFIAAQTITALISTQIQGVTGTAQDAQTKAANWDKATQWSLPKVETLGLFVPGLFGYKMDTPNGMMPLFQDAYRNGNYWGGMGRDPAIDRYFDNGGKNSPPSNWMRQTAGVNYCGILVALIAFWAVAQSFRKKDSVFTDTQKKFIWFWAAVAMISLPIAWGRFAPMFYGALYHLPYFSTIRSPAKFVTFFTWAILVLFAHGVHGLSLRHFTNNSAQKGGGLNAQLTNWWRRASRFDRKWTFALVGILIASVLGWLIYDSEKAHFIQYLQKVGFGDEKMAAGIADFSLSQVKWFLALLAGAIVLITLVIAGYFNGARARLGGILLGAFLLFDLVRADLPYIIHWNYIQKYEIGSLNPIEDFLRQKPYEHRVAKLLPAPLSTPSQFELFDQLYAIEWTQQHFPYYNIQSLDIIQMPRMPEDLKTYLQTLSIGIKQNKSGQYMLDETTFPRLTRLWELSNTRYLLGPAAFVSLFNQQFDPSKGRFRIAQRFEVVPKPGIEQPTQLSELTAVPNPNGKYALIEFTGALPRAKLYSNWQVNTNDADVLKTLADLNFDPAKTLLLSTPDKDFPSISTNENSGSVAFKSYAPKKIVFDAKATTPSILLLNDKYDPHWSVTVDGQPAKLLRCNYIMRGVYLPPGTHTVTFHFQILNKPLYVTSAAIIVGLLLILSLLVRQKPTAS